MLKLTVSGKELWDEENQRFIPPIKDHTLRLEHSLISLYKWEGIYKKPFLSTEKDLEMIKAYAKCMCLDANIPDEVFDRLSADNIKAIADYIKDDQTATWFSDNKKAHDGGKMNGETITAELVYYWMISMQIPVEFQKWHLNRLLTLIRVISIKNDPKGGKPKMTNSERAALNKARKAKYHTRG